MCRGCTSCFGLKYASDAIRIRQFVLYSLSKSRLFGEKYSVVSKHG